MNHTPGPWRISAADAREGCIESVEGSNRVTIGRVYDIRRNRIGKPTAQEISEATANARLIAAAPELLNALRSLLEHEGETEVNGIGIESDSEALEHAKKLARAAIAAATGK